MMMMILHTYTNTKHRRTLSFQTWTGVLIPGFGSWWHEERETILTMLTPSQRTAHLVMFKILIHLHRLRPEKLNCRCNGGKLNSMPQWSNLNCRFFKILKSSGPSLPGMISSTPQPYLYYDIWWLSYLLRTSVKLQPMTMHLDLRNPKSSKPYQSEW